MFFHEKHMLHINMDWSGFESLFEDFEEVFSQDFTLTVSILSLLLCLLLDDRNRLRKLKLLFFLDLEPGLECPENVLVDAILYNN